MLMIRAHIAVNFNLLNAMQNLHTAAPWPDFESEDCAFESRRGRFLFYLTYPIQEKESYFARQFNMFCNEEKGHLFM